MATIPRHLWQWILYVRMQSVDTMRGERQKQEGQRHQRRRYRLCRCRRSLARYAFAPTTCRL